MDQNKNEKINEKGKSKIFDSEYYNLPCVEDPQIHVDDDIILKKFGVVDKFIDFIGIH